MRKIFILAICLVLAMAVFCVPAFAEETSDTVASEVEPGIKDEIVETYHTVLSRLGEWFEENKVFFTSLASGVIMLTSIVIVAIKYRKSLRWIIETVKVVTGKTDGVYDAQTQVIDRVNVLSDGYAEMARRYEEREKADEERTKIMATVLIETTTILEMLQTAYAHNRNVPQSFKDVINVRYANCMKAVENDTELAQCVAAIKSSLAKGGGTEETSKEV